jgi:hypothetical protein
LNIDFGIKNERQGCKIGTECGGGVEEMNLREYGLHTYV